MIRVGIVGFGNLGKCVLERVQKEPQMQAVCVFTRRPQQVVCNVPVYDLCEASKFAKDLDVLALCLGSRVDLPRYAPELAQIFGRGESETSNLFDHRRRVGSRAAFRVADVCRSTEWAGNRADAVGKGGQSGA